MNLLFRPDQNMGHGPAEPSGPPLPLLLWICDCLGAALLPAQGTHTMLLPPRKPQISGLVGTDFHGQSRRPGLGLWCQIPRKLHLNLLQHTTSPHPIWVSILESEGRAARTQLSFVSASVLCLPLGRLPSLCVAHTICYLSHHFI